MRIIYQENDNMVMVRPVDSFLDTLEGTLEEKMIYLANKDLPTGTRYELVDNSTIPDDDFRDAWEYVAGSDERTSEDLSLDDQLKYNHITQEEYDAS